uniref:Essential meiotic structure-specific endonuclease 1 n=1 Tax=Mastacembelus armatus TaxID=205130 RepID=A0A3Q3ST16_9TELE
MGSYSDSTSDLEEELPVFDFLQAGPHLSRSAKSYTGKPDLVELDDSEAESAAISSSVKVNEGAGKKAADVMIISSDSDDDASYVPLAQRLKQRHGNVITDSTSVTNGKDIESGQFSLANTSSAMNKPAKRTAEENRVSKEKALKRRQARERQQSDKEALRLEQERQKAERKALVEAARALRPEECIKHMVVAVDPALLQLEEGGTLLASVQALGCSCAIEKQPLPRSVSWLRRELYPYDGVCVPEAHVVMQMTVDDFITLTHSYIQKHSRSDPGPTLTSWVQEQQKHHPDKILSLVVIDLEKYFRSQKSQSQKRFREAVMSKDHVGGKAKKRRKNGEAEVLPEVSRVEVEEAVVHLQLHTGVSVRFLPTWKDFSVHITMTTKAVAEAPFKRDREKTGFSFYLDSEWAGGQRVDKAGKGLLQVWKRQIQQLNRVSPDMASAILAAYPSLQLLKKAYSQCKTDREKISLLSDLLIRRGEGVTSTTRRVGSELSKRLFLMMNSCDPEQTLDSTA